MKEKKICGGLEDNTFVSKANIHADFNTTCTNYFKKDFFKNIHNFA